MSAKRLFQLFLILIVLLGSLAATSRAQAHAALNADRPGAARNQAAWCGETYVVQRGDWLARIARNCGVSLAELRAANPWTYYDRYIYPGDVLAIPGNWGGPEPEPGPSGYCGPSWDAYGGYWLVCRGDTLGAIARYYGVSWRYLQYNNGIANANRIYPGQVIRP